MQAQTAQRQPELSNQRQLEEILKMEEEAKEKIRLQQEQMEEELRKKPPSQMKVDDDMASDKLIIDETIVETPESKMTESKDVITFSADGGVPGLYSAKVVQRAFDHGEFNGCIHLTQKIILGVNKHVFVICSWERVFDQEEFNRCVYCEKLS
uniref:Uncharacterized protein n=1 Tax=Romanomermis culicivorax TaxID=13658 RepID=A0A915J1C9_ROMCU